MKNNQEQITAAITQMIFENKLEDIFAEFDTKTVIDFLKKALSDDPDFGKTGNYTFFCKACAGQWSFTDKTEKQIFEKLHKITGCSLKPVLFENKKKNTKAWGITKNGKNIPIPKQEHIQNLISTLEKRNGDPETVVHEEQTAAASE